MLTIDSERSYSRVYGNVRPTNTRSDDPS
jgi:hypothetical protein